MKQIKKLVTLFTLFTFCLVFFLTTSLPAQAATEPVTFYVKYVPALGEWRFQTGGWSDNADPRHLYYMQDEIKDGSLLVIDDAGAGQGITLSVNAQLSNLTVLSSNFSNITAKGVDDFYSLGSSKSVINAPIAKAYVYDNSLVNFNSPVEYLEVISSREETLHATVGASSTVAHLKAYGPSRVFYEIFNVATNKLSISDGSLKTEEQYYSKVPVAAPATPVAPAPAPATPGTSDADEYDDVPKTGDNRIQPLWLMLLSALCLASAYSSKKKAQ